MRLAEREVLQILSVLASRDADDDHAQGGDAQGGDAQGALSAGSVGGGTAEELGTAAMELLAQLYSQWSNAAARPLPVQPDRAAEEDGTQSLREEWEGEGQPIAVAAVASHRECAEAVQALQAKLRAQGVGEQESQAAAEEYVGLLLEYPAVASRWPRAQESCTLSRLVGLKQLGNESYRHKHYALALDAYQDALRLCDTRNPSSAEDATAAGGGGGSGGGHSCDNFELVSEFDELERDCLLNAAACCLSADIDRPDAARVCCDAALGMAPHDSWHNAWKAFWRRGQVRAINLPVSTYLAVSIYLSI